MGWRTLVVLVLLIGGIAASLHFTEQDTTGDEGLSEAVLDGRRIHDLSKLLINTQPDQPSIEFARAADGRIEMVEPIRDYASEAMFENIARNFDRAFMRRKHTAEELDADPELIEQLELDPPLGRFEIEWPDGHRIELAFGGAGAFGNEIHVMRDGEVFVAEGSLKSCLHVNLSDYRSPFVFRNRTSDVRVLTLERALLDGSTETLTFREKGSQLFVEEAGDMLLSQAVVRATVDRILAMRVERFARGGAHEIGVADAAYRIDVDGLRGREQVDLYRVEGDALLGWARPRDVLFGINPLESAEALNRPLEHLRSVWLFPIDEINKFEAITIGVPGERTLTLTRRPSGLEMASPYTMRCNDSATADLVTALGKFVVGRFEPETTELGDVGLDEGYVTLRLKDPLQREEIEVHIGRREPEFSYVRRADLPHVFAVTNEAVDPIRRPWVDYATLEVLRVKLPGSIVGLDVERGDSTVRFDKDDRGIWLDETGAESAIAEEAFDRVRDLVGTRAFAREGFEELPEPIVYRLRRAGQATPIELEMFVTDDRVLVGRRGHQILYEVRSGDRTSLLALAPGS